MLDVLAHHRRPVPACVLVCALLCAACVAVLAGPASAGSATITRRMPSARAGRPTAGKAAGNDERHASPQVAGVTFDPPVDYTVPGASGVVAVALTDVTGDGRTDVLATTNDVYEHQLLMYAQQAEGTLAAPQIISTGLPTVGVRQLQIATGDLTGDGATDVAVSVSHDIALFDQKPGGGLPSTPSTIVSLEAFHSSAPTGIAITDLNGDGLRDLEVIEYATSSGTDPDEMGTFVLFNNGSGLDAPTQIATGAPEWMAVADVTGDGRPDVTTVEGNGSVAVVVQRQTSTGSFVAASYPIPGQRIACSFVVADFNKDGRRDVADADCYGSVVWILRQTSTGTLGTPGRHLSEQYPEALAAADMNMDGRTDLLADSNYHPLLSLLPQETNGTIGPKVTYPLCTCGFDHGLLTVGDVNDDGFKDVVAGYSSNNSIRVLLQQKHRDTLTLSVPSHAAPPGTQVSLSGKLTYFDGAKPAGKSIQLQVTEPGGAPTTFATVTTGATGGYSAKSPSLSKTGTYTFTASFAGDTLHAKATQATTVLSTVVTLTVSAGSVVYGGNVTLTVHLSNYHTTSNKTVSIYQTPDGEAESLLASGTVGSTGNFVRTIAPAKTTSYVADWSGDGTYDAVRSFSRPVVVHVAFHNALSGYYKISGSYRLYHYHASCPAQGNGCPTYVAHVAPNREGDCVRFQIQYYRGKWQGTQTTSCASLDASSSAGVIWVYGGSGVKGIPWRTRAWFTGGTSYGSTYSAWAYFKVTA